MRCDEIHEHWVDLIYDEGGTAPANDEIRDHLRTCPACRDELEELTRTRKYLQAWKDESPLRSVAVARQESLLRRKSGWRYVRYGAVAAMALICFLALANTEIRLNESGFSFTTSLFSRNARESEYYTKGEIRELMKRALDDSESRVNESNYLMMQKMLDTVEQERWMDLRFVRPQRSQNNNRN